MTKLWLGDGVDFDVSKVDDHRTLVQASSGGGKSYALRKLLEITYGAIPHVVLDVEGEFHTLREKFDYVLAGRGGDCPATIQTAPLLARRVLELGFSLIIDLSELPHHQREEFVKRFLESMVESPRALWRPMLVVVDEAHKFCPEGERCTSSAAVIDLMTRGRKRGFGGVLATQRLAKLSKDAAAECPNKLIGRTGLPDDRKRAGEEIGFTSKAETLVLRKLHPGEFYAFGPALSFDDAKLFTVGQVETTHPKAGARAIPPTPPKDRVRKVIAQLADLPAEAEAEARTAAELREQVKQLRRELASKPSAKVETETIERFVLKDGQLKRAESAISAVDKLITRWDDLSANAHAASEEQGKRLTEAFHRVASELAPVRDAIAKTQPTNREVAQKHHASTGRMTVHSGKHEIRVPAVVDGEALSSTKQRILNALAALEVIGVRQADKTQLALFAKQSPTSSGYTHNLGALRTAGLIDYPSPGSATLTDDGRKVADSSDAPTSSAELHTYVQRLLGSSRWNVLVPLIDAYPNAIAKDDLAKQANVSASSSGYTHNLGALRSLGLLDYPRSGEVRAADLLFIDGGS